MDKLAEVVGDVELLPPINEKVLLRKIDRRVIPVLFVIYMAAFLDRYVFFEIHLRLVVERLMCLVSISPMLLH